MNKIGIFLVLTVAALTGGCDVTGIRGDGNVVTAQRPIGPFSELRTSGAVKVEWRSGPPAVSVTTDENLMQYFETKNVGKRLELRMRERVRPTHGVKVVLSGPSLSGARLSGAADLIAHSVSGTSFSVQSTGAADITVDGTVEQLLADLTGASQLRAKGLQAKVVEISTTGAADAWVTANEKLRVAITGAGDVTYSGNPPTIEKHITGAGSIHHKD
jgi:hypothetical protein